MGLAIAAIAAGIPVARAQDAITTAPPATAPPLTAPAPTPANPPAVSPSGAAPNPIVTMVERSAKGPTAKSIQVGIYLNVLADCTSGPLPSLRLVSPPANGTVSIKRGKVSATNLKQCLALEVPGFIAFYQSKPDFAGTDVAVIEVKYPQGRTEVQRITIQVGASAGGAQKI